MWIMILGIAILIQILYMMKAVETKNYWAIKSSIIDIFLSLFILGIVGAGGVVAFKGAVMATFMLTIYLKIIKKHDFDKPEPKFWTMIFREKT